VKIGKLIKTPNNRLPIGEPVEHDDGSRWIRLKGKGRVYEEVSISWLDKVIKKSLNLNTTL